MIMYKDLIGKPLADVIPPTWSCDLDTRYDLTDDKRYICILPNDTELSVYCDETNTITSIIENE